MSHKLPNLFSRPQGGRVGTTAGRAFPDRTSASPARLSALGPGIVQPAPHTALPRPPAPSASRTSPANQPEVKQTAPAGKAAPPPAPRPGIGVQGRPAPSRAAGCAPATPPAAREADGERGERGASGAARRAGYLPTITTTPAAWDAMARRPAAPEPRRKCEERRATGRRTPRAAPDPRAGRGGARAHWLGAGAGGGRAGPDRLREGRGAGPSPRPPLGARGRRNLRRTPGLRPALGAQAGLGRGRTGRSRTPAPRREDPPSGLRALVFSCFSSQCAPQSQCTWERAPPSCTGLTAKAPPKETARISY